jgi:cyclophilin family peptidyl-prolyl cis-trans isomerase
MHAAPVATAPVGPPPRVVLEIAQGEEDWGRIVLELNPEKTPITVENFLRYVDSGYYDGTIFHRVLPNFMIQGGGYMALIDFPSRDGWGYCAFGTVVEGMDVVDRIRRVPTQRDPAGPDQAPSQPVDPPRIKRASREGGAPATQTADSQPAPGLPSETMPEPPPADEPRPTEPPGPTPVPESPPAEPAQPN